jgi:hypothetical protein
MDEENDNIYVLTKEQAAELISKKSFNSEQVAPVRFSTILLISIVIFILCITLPILLIVLAPVFFIEYVTKKIFERKEVTDEDSHTIN